MSHMPWYNFDLYNSKLLLMLLANTCKPIIFYFTKELPVNHILLMKVRSIISKTRVIIKCLNFQIGKSVYSALAIITNMNNLI